MVSVESISEIHKKRRKQPPPLVMFVPTHTQPEATKNRGDISESSQGKWCTGCFRHPKPRCRDGILKQGIGGVAFLYNPN